MSVNDLHLMAQAGTGVQVDSQRSGPDLGFMTVRRIRALGDPILRVRCETITNPQSLAVRVVVDDLEANDFRNVRLWSRGVDQSIFRPQESRRLDSAPPIYLYVGRVAVEKNVEAFLELDLPGSKWVVGTGPAIDGIRARFPQANYLGLLDREELARVYAAADVFVFPSRTDTFGLVLLEAMACGLPVAAYPVTGPRDVIGDSKAGVLHEDLRTACLEALKLRREDAVARAGLFTWRAATEQFLGHLHPRQRGVKLTSLVGEST